MPVVKTAFAKAFGDTLEVTVDKDGKMQAVATLQNMIINMGSEYYANVLTISNGTTLREIYPRNEWTNSRNRSS